MFGLTTKHSRILSGSVTDSSSRNSEDEYKHWQIDVPTGEDLETLIPRDNESSNEELQMNEVV